MRIFNSWQFKRWLRMNLGKSSFYHYFRFFINKKHIDNIAKAFFIETKNFSRKLIKEAWVKYHWNFYEFFYWDYENISDEERKSFVPEYEKNIFCDKANNHKDDLIFHDKWTTYQKFKDFFKRDAIIVSDKKSLLSNNAVLFFLKHKKFIIKPINAASGRGIKILSIKETDIIEDILLPILEDLKSPCVIEELIIQSSTLADFHPNSVNTLRIPTFRFNDNETLIFHPFLRIGQKGNIVDNAGAGGIMGLVDIKTGCVFAASDERCNCYTKHPDTNLDIVGFRIPMWEEALVFVKKLADVIPNVRYVGWDIALTEKGWVLIEGNEKGQFLWQIPTKEGFRDEFEAICKQANVKM